MKPLPAVHCRCAVTGSSIREASKGSELLIVLLVVLRKMYVTIGITEKMAVEK